MEAVAVEVGASDTPLPDSHPGAPGPISEAASITAALASYNQWELRGSTDRSNARMSNGHPEKKKNITTK